MAVEINGAPLKFTAEFDYKDAHKSMNDFYAEIAKKNKDLFGDAQPASNVLAEILKKSAKEAANTTDELQKLAAANQKAAQKKVHEDNAQAIRESRLEAQKHREEQQKQVAEYARLRAEQQKHKATIEELKVAGEALNNSFRDGKIEAQEYELEQKKLADAQKNAAAAQKEADRQAKERLNLLSAELRLARQQEAQKERNRKKLQQESSEYYKLNQALNAVRRRSKDVLAEMFNLERQGQKNTDQYRQLEQRSKSLVSQTLILDNGIKKIDSSLGLHQRNVGNYGMALDRLVPVFGRINMQLMTFGTSIDQLATKPDGFKEFGRQVAAVGSGIGKFLLSPIGLLITALAGLYALISGNASTVTTFNSGLLNVSKTTGIADRELTKLGDKLVGLSRQLKVLSTDKLLEYATVAGQLGVKGSQNILAFTEALAKLETASNISGEEGGAEIARLLTLTDGGVQNVAAFGDEIVNLGNNFAATEKEILSNAEAIAQNTGQYRIGRQDVLAYAAATKSVGLEAEVVGSTFARTLGQFEKIIRTGKNLDVVMKATGLSAEELRKQFKTNASGVFNEFVRGLHNIDQAGGSVNATLEKIGINQVRDQRVISSLATNGYAVLEDALIKVREAAGAMDAEFETASTKLTNQMGRIRIAWQNLVLSIENGQGPIGRAAAMLSGMFADALERVTKILTTTGWDEFMASLTDFKAADKIREITLAANEANEAMKMSTSLDFNKTGVKELEDAYRGVEKSYKEVTKQHKIYQEAVNRGVLTESGKRNLKDYQRLITNLGWEMNRLQRGIVGKTPVQSTTGVVSGSTELSDAEKRAIEAAKRRAEQALKSQRDLQGKIDDINRAAQRRQLSRDEEEVQSVKDKYEQIARAIENFRKDSRNKGLQVDASGLNASMEMEVARTVAKQQLEVEKQIIAERKAVFDEYEKYKLQVGASAAKQAFQDQIGEFESYVQWLRSIRPAETDRSVSANTRRDYIDFTAMPAANKEQVKRDQEQYRISLQNAQSFADQVRNIQTRLEQDIANIKDRGSKEQIDMLRLRARDEISQITTAAIQEETQWEAVFANMVNMTDKASKEWLDQAQLRIDVANKEGRLVAQDYVKMNQQIQAANQEINLRNPFIGITDTFKTYKKDLSDMRTAQGVYNRTVEQYGDKSDEARQALEKLNSAQQKANNSFRQFAGVVAQYSQMVGSVVSGMGRAFDMLGVGDEKLQGTIDRIGSLVSGIGELSAGIASKNPVQIVSGAVNALVSAIDLFNTRDRRLQRQMENYQQALKGLQDQYAALDRAIQNSVGGSVYDDSARQIRNLEDQNRNLANQVRAEAAKKKADQSVIDANNQQIRDNLIQIEEIGKRIADVTLQSDFRQLSDNLASALVNAIKQGEDAISSMDKTFEEFIANAVTNSLRLGLLEVPIKKLTDDMLAYAQNNNNSILGFDFDKAARPVVEAGRQFEEAFRAAMEAFDIDFEETEQPDRGMSGTVGRAITEDTANKWMGVQLNIYTLFKSSLAEAQRQSQLQANLVSIAQANLRAVLGIEQNTAETVVQLRTAVGHLLMISNNTKPSVDVARNKGF